VVRCDGDDNAVKTFRVWGPKVLCGIGELCALPESPWSEWNRGKPISARSVARLLGGVVLSISEAGAPMPAHRGRAMAEMAVAAPVPIAGGEQAISASISVTFAIE
jgi:hypothetical protein